MLSAPFLTPTETKILVLLCASVERFGVSRMTILNLKYLKMILFLFIGKREFSVFPNILKKKNFKFSKHPEQLQQQQKVWEKMQFSLIS